MKKTIILAASCALMLTSCSRPPQSVDDAPSLRFNVTAVDGFSTRVANITSSDAIQAITDVRVHVFRTTDGGANYLYVRTYDLTPEWRQGNNSVTHNVTRDEMLENGSYRFLAVGMDS